MRRFTDLYLELDGTNSTREKTAAIQRHLAAVEDEDAAWAIAFLTGNRPKGLGVSRLLRELCLEVADCPSWLFEECRTAVGDLSETIALLLPPAEEIRTETLATVMADRVLPLATAAPAAKRRMVREAWAALGSHERLVYHKLVRGGFRVGVQRQTVVRAVAALAGLEVDLVAHRLTGRFEPTAAAYRRLLEPERPDEHRERPYPFFLAHALEGDVEALGPIDDWIVEEKWDGIRAQLIVRSSERRLWSRGEESIGHLFPSLLAGPDLPVDTVLDGEVLLWGEHGPKSFFELQRRLNRKAAPDAQLSLFERDDARFIAYDLLEADGVDLRDRPLEARRRRLASMCDELAHPAIDVSRPLEAPDWRTATTLRDAARDRRTEGLMLKPRASAYGVGRTRGGDGWIKWKIEPLTADAVLIGAQPGSGRRANLYTDYTFAIWDRTGPEARLASFAKAYSGLAQEEIEEVDRWIRGNTVERSGPYRVVRPDLVFELAFEGIQRSDRHRSGLAVRFPRILRRRPDKPASEADDLDTIRNLLDRPRTPPREDHADPTSTGP